MFDIDRRFKKNSQVLCKEIAGEPVLVDPYRREVMRLNPTAAEIWRLLDGERTPRDIINTLKDIFDVDEKVLQKDTLDFMKELIKLEIIA